MPHFQAAYSQEITVNTNGPGPSMDMTDYAHAGTPLTSLVMIAIRRDGVINEVDIRLQISLDGEVFAPIPDAVVDGIPTRITTLTGTPKKGMAGFHGIPFCYARFSIINIAQNTLTMQMMASRA